MASLEVILAGAATIFGVAMSSAYFPQLYRTLKRKSSEDLSLLMFSTMAVGVTVWLAYGLVIRNYPLIIVNLVGVAGTYSVLFAAIKYRRKHPSKK